MTNNNGNTNDNNLRDLAITHLADPVKSVSGQRESREISPSSQAITGGEPHLAGRSTARCDAGLVLWMMAASIMYFSPHKLE
jgi:hypothetical protein